jgi:hypothetical protein
MSLAAKVRRKAVKLANRFTGISHDKIVKLESVLESPPHGREAIDQWTAEASALINDIVLDRIAKEDIALILAGLVSYRATGTTPQASQAALIRAYENTSGLFQEALHRALFDHNLPALPERSALFGEINATAIERIMSELSSNGYSLLPFKLAPGIVAQLQAETRGFTYRLKGGAQSGQQVTGIDLSNPPKTISAYSDTAPSEAMQRIINDELLTYIASQHLGTPAKAIDSTLWYTFPNPVASSETAQLFHYDLDTIRWVKVFVYLSDVGPQNGPHEYVAGTHLPQNKAQQIMVKEYARISDAEIDQYYPGRRRQVSGPAGTVIIGDTRCFHKGNAVAAGHRLIFSPIYAPSRIGYFHG